jgi:murein L,D-transpeptidase YcbB/YkuD
MHQALNPTDRMQWSVRGQLGAVIRQNLDQVAHLIADHNALPTLSAFYTTQHAEFQNFREEMQRLLDIPHPEADMVKRGGRLWWGHNITSW